VISTVQESPFATVEQALLFAKEVVSSKVMEVMVRMEMEEFFTVTLFEREGVFTVTVPKLTDAGETEIFG